MAENVVWRFSALEASSVQWLIAFVKSDSDGARFAGFSDYHFQIITTRKLILSDSRIFASPIHEDFQQINIIVEKEHYEAGNLCKLFEDLQLNYTPQKTPCDKVYEACLQYSMVTRIAPEWNLVNRYLVEGTNFLTSNEILNATDIKLHVRDNTVYIEARMYKIKLPLMNTNEMIAFDRSAILSQNFNGSYTIDLSAQYKIAHVLPSLKRGRVVEVSNKIPSDSIFKTYGEIKDHWNKMYGYVLPETDENIIYYSILFWGKYFTYPDICLRKYDIVFMPQRNENLATVSFIEHLRRKCLIGILKQSAQQINCGFPSANFQIAKNTLIRETRIESQTQPAAEFDINNNLIESASYPEQNKFGFQFASLKFNQSQAGSSELNNKNSENTSAIRKSVTPVYRPIFFKNKDRSSESQSELNSTMKTFQPEPASSIWKYRSPSNGSETNSKVIGDCHKTGSLNEQTSFNI